MLEIDLVSTHLLLYKYQGYKTERASNHGQHCVPYYLGLSVAEVGEYGLCRVRVQPY
jgi:hypothetical protein